MHKWGITLDDIALYRAIGLLGVGDNLGDNLGDKWGITFCNTNDTLCGGAYILQAILPRLSRLILFVAETGAEIARIYAAFRFMLFTLYAMSGAWAHLGRFLGLFLGKRDELLRSF